MLSNILDYLELGKITRTPDQIAIIDQHRSFTFAQIELHSKSFGTLLMRRTDARREPIAVFLFKSADMVFADLGIAFTGNIYTNLDVKSPPQRIRNILDNLRPVIIITSMDLAPRLVALGVAEAALFFVEQVMGEEPQPDTAALEQRLSTIIDTDPLCIINTSGSTGTPKGVVLHHRGTIDFMEWVFATLPVDGTERIGSLSPFHFDIYTLELLLCIAKGATLVLIPEHLSAFPAKLINFLQENQVNFIFWVPSIMVNIANQGLLDKVNLPNMKTIFFAGEVFPTRHLNLWRKALPTCNFVNLYGPIEIHVDCTYFIVNRKFADDEPLPIGFACRNTDILVLDENNSPCGIGRQGELCVRGSSLAHGYWNDPEKTAQAFVQNPNNGRYPELIYRTGDLVYRNDQNEIMLVGRKDFQIKHLGYRIELPEIEHQVLCIKGVSNACVLYNQERKEISLFFESTETPITPAYIRSALAEIFPKYMIPTVFYQMDELPRNSNGKIDRNGLMARMKESV